MRRLRVAPFTGTGSTGKLVAAVRRGRRARRQTHLCACMCVRVCLCEGVFGQLVDERLAAGRIGAPVWIKMGEEAALPSRAPPLRSRWCGHLRSGVVRVPC